MDWDSLEDSLEQQIRRAQYPEQSTLKKWASIHNLTTLDGTHWHHRTALVVVVNDELRRGVISLFHDHKASRHPGITKTLQLIAPYYWWPNMKTFVTEYIKGCATCQMSKINRNPAHPPLFPIVTILPHLFSFFHHVTRYVISFTSPSAYHLSLTMHSSPLQTLLQSLGQSC
jgi:hypothetical protein